MARTPRENRDEVATAIVNLRITAPEKEALDALVKRQQAQIAGLGVVAPISQATVIRTLIQREARAIFGAFPIGQTEQPLPAPQVSAQAKAPVEGENPIMVAPEPPAPEPETPTSDMILEAVRRLADPKTGLVYVPALVRELGGEDSLKAELVKLDADGLLELRPESGVGLLSEQDAKLCPKGANGVILSMVREKKTALPQESSSSPIVPDKKKLQARFAKAIERKKTSTTAMAAEISVSTALLQKFRRGDKGLGDANAMALAAALDRIGG